MDGERSGLWGEFKRIIGELRPRYVLIENVPMLLAGGDWVDGGTDGVVRETGEGSPLGDPAAGPSQPRVAKNVPNRVERLRGLGNAVVPQVAELIGRMIMAYESQE